MARFLPGDSLAFPARTQGRIVQKEYDKIGWRNNETEFKAWCEGRTGYPIVDAGMRELNATGFMHNRVRMITASFLTKHLLIDWRWGEAYFAKSCWTMIMRQTMVAGNGLPAAVVMRLLISGYLTQRCKRKNSTRI